MTDADLSPPTRPARRLAILFGLLLAAFVGRVLAQLVQLLRPTSLLPPFAAFQSGTLPYPALFASQIAIILSSALFLRSLWLGRLRPRRRLGQVLWVIGVIYFVGATFRLVAGLSFLSHVAFFALPIPSSFHMVLAGMLLIVAGKLRGSRG